MLINLSTFVWLGSNRSGIWTQECVSRGLPSPPRIKVTAGGEGLDKESWQLLTTSDSCQSVNQRLQWKLEPKSKIST